MRALPCAVQQHRKHGIIADAGSSPEHLMMLLEGYASRVKLTRWGDQPVVGFLLPGDLFDWSGMSLRATVGATRDTPLDHSICAATSSLVAVFRTAPLLKLIEEWPEIRHALDGLALVERNVTREWLANVAGRPAAERVAHVLCEHFWRMTSLGLADGDSCPLPFSQARLSASQGLSVVHTNRVLRRLYEEGLVEARGRTLRVLDLKKLQVFADFSPAYLNCAGTPAAALVGRG